jgi:uncharacterized SAM-binding protein YcdF (DUF218 family)
MRRASRTGRWLVAFAAATAVAWLGGFAWFVYGSLSLSGNHDVATDAIVVLTGGRSRLETGLELLGAGKARKLLVSGVNPRVDRAELERVVGPLPDLDSDRVTLGYAAGNTEGNARETADWMRRQGYASLRLVTSWYHMRRSLAEF